LPAPGIDDDVEGLYKLSGDKLIQIKNVAGFFEQAYQNLKKEQMECQVL